MSSKASATELVIWDESMCLQLQVLLQSSTFVLQFAALILATHFPVKMWLTLMEPAASRNKLQLKLKAIYDYCIQKLNTNEISTITIGFHPLIFRVSLAVRDNQILITCYVYVVCVAVRMP